MFSYPRWNLPNSCAIPLHAQRGAKAIHGKNQGKLFIRKILNWKNLEVSKYNQSPLKHKLYHIKKCPFTKQTLGGPHYILLATQIFLVLDKLSKTVQTEFVWVQILNGGD